ncbi:MAG: hypothetical protein IJJ51_03990 [Kiritimatiellae bacterium]|nr:hypothetical protein [Kiritimatiellia bacterium]
MRINPFTVKELRQLTRSKAISGTLVAFLFVCLLVCYLTPINYGIRHDTGLLCFVAILFVLSFVLGLVLPVDVYQRLTKERGTKRSAADFTLLTALGPADVIDGKIHAAFVLMVLYTTAAMPFAVVAYLLHGVSFAYMAQSLAAVFFTSLAMVHLMLAAASLKLPLVLRNTICAIAVFALCCAACPIFAEALFFDGTYGSVHGFALLLAILATACLLLRGAAIAFFSPAVVERDRPLRMAVLICLVGWYCYALWPMESGDAGAVRDRLTALAIFGTLLSAALAAYASAQPARRSRRMLAARSSMGALRRLASWPFASGAAPAFAFALAVGLFCTLQLPLFRRWIADHIPGDPTASLPLDSTLWLCPVDIVLYAFAMLMAARTLWMLIAVRRDARPPRFSPAAVPFAAAAVFFLLQSVPPLLEILKRPLETTANFPFLLEGVSDFPVGHLFLSGGAFAAATLLLCLASFIATRK